MVKSTLKTGEKVAISSNLGFPRIGRNRELKKALENYWEGKIIEDDLYARAKKIRIENWKIQKQIGIDHIPSNDFSLYDQMLDTIILLGAIPERFQGPQASDSLDTYFAMARGAENGELQGLPALEMTKWFNTNYHYLVPEISRSTIFKKNTKKIISDFREAQEVGIKTRPVIIGPVTFLLLSKSITRDLDPISRINELLPIYKEIFEELVDNQVEWIQLDEPCLAKDLEVNIQEIYKEALREIGTQSKRPKILLSTYFDTLEENLPIVLEAPCEAIHLDLTHSKKDFETILKLNQKDKIFSLGIVNGRNVWKTDFEIAKTIIKRAIHSIPTERIIISPSCSFLHVPQDLDLEANLKPEVRNLLAFGKQKLMEIVELTKWLNENRHTGIGSKANIPVQGAIKPLSFKHDQDVIDRIGKISLGILKRQSEFNIRKQKQNKKYSLPLLPITTIGSFPQTKLIRTFRSRFGNHEIGLEEYKNFIKSEISRTIKFQEEIGLDVLVHGEFERNDMVQYFAEQMEGFAFTDHGWVQSFGSRLVRPPIIYGDVSRPKMMTVSWSIFAQSQTAKPVKGMLTGPITILNWSFVRNDQPQMDTCRQIALAIRDEVHDLEKEGIGIIQIDEPALREGLPLHRRDWDEYLNWAVECFKICTSGVRDDTQIHTHMCYSEFNDIIKAIAGMDADVISIEAARSHMELLKAFSTFQYPNDIGPGVYDIHSPRIPKQEEIYLLLKEAMKVLPIEQIWVNPDCGLKTRKWKEVEPALKAIVSATRQLRQEIQTPQKKA